MVTSYFVLKCFWCASSVLKIMMLYSFFLWSLKVEHLITISSCVSSLFSLMEQLSELFLAGGSQTCDYTPGRTLKVSCCLPEPPGCSCCFLLTFQAVSSMCRNELSCWFFEIFKIFVMLSLSPPPLIKVMLSKYIKLHIEFILTYGLKWKEHSFFTRLYKRISVLKHACISSEDKTSSIQCFRTGVVVWNSAVCLMN